MCQAPERENRKQAVAGELQRYFLRCELGAGVATTGLRSGTMAPRAGSAAALARESTSSWMYFTKS